MFLDQAPANVAVTKDDHVAMYDLHYSWLRNIFAKKKKLNSCLQLISSFHTTWEEFTRYITPASLEATIDAFQNDLKRVFDKSMSISNECDCGKDTTSPDFVFPKFMVKLPFKFNGCIAAISSSRNPRYAEAFIDNMDILNMDIFSYSLSSYMSDYNPKKFACEMGCQEPEEILEKLDEPESEAQLTKFYQNYQKYEDLRYTRDLRQFSSTVVDTGCVLDNNSLRGDILINFYNKVFNKCLDHLNHIRQWAINDNPAAIFEIKEEQIEVDNPQGATQSMESTKAMSTITNDNRYFKPNSTNTLLLHCMKDEVSTCWLIAQMLMFSKFSIKAL